MPWSEAALEHAPDGLIPWGDAASEHASKNETCLFQLVMLMKALRVNRADEGVEQADGSHCVGLVLPTQSAETPHPPSIKA
eukprot:1137842-Pelagomonas_calceolata.AAC.2